MALLADHQVSASYPIHRPRPPRFEEAIQAVAKRGFVIGREVMMDQLPGLIVGYNISGFGRFIGHAYPLVVRTEQGVTMAHPDQLALI